DGASLKTAFSTTQPDVVLLDLRLPDADGLDLLSAIKRNWPETEVIVLSGYGTLDAAVEATKRGAFHFVTKRYNEGWFRLFKGAFTGALGDREGLFRHAESGTLLLDELSEMPVDTQIKLLRVLQEKEVRPVGGKTSYKTDCRVIASTNRRVEDAIKDSKLREDLYYRISAISVHLPPLRERREDILHLARAFLKRFASQA